MTIHIGACPGDIAETVLLPGDPLRAKWAAETFLENPRQINALRGMQGYTGHWRGHPVTIHGSGMGMPSLSIYAHELIRDFGARTLIRIGSAGSMQDHVHLRDLVLAMSCSARSTPSAGLFPDFSFAPCADFGLLAAAHGAAQRRGYPVHVGGIHSSDAFYDERPELDAQLRRHGVLAVEMEAAELYTLAARFGARALAVLTISDHLPSRESLTPDERESGFAAMVEVALAAAFPEG